MKKKLIFITFINFRCEKMTKINVLHVAINYIRALESILDTGDAGIHIYGTSVVQSPNLPISPEAEPPIEKVVKNPPKSTPNSIRRGNSSKNQQQKTTQQQFLLLLMKKKYSHQFALHLT